MGRLKRVKLEKMTPAFGELVTHSSEGHIPEVGRTDQVQKLGK